MPVLLVIDMQNDFCSPDCCIMYTGADRVMRHSDVREIRDGAATPPDAQAAACRHMHAPRGIPVITLQAFMQETGALPC